MGNPTLFWISHAALALVALFFIVFGIDLLCTAYQINEPFSFIMTFFASNLIILISATLLLHFILKIVAYMKKTRE